MHLFFATDGQNAVRGISGISAKKPLTEFGLAFALLYSSVH